MKPKGLFSLLLIFVAASFLGGLFFLFKYEWIIIKSPLSSYNRNLLENLSTKSALVKRVNLYYWQKPRFSFEAIPIVLQKNKGENIKRLTSMWLDLLFDEKILDCMIVVEAVLETESGQDVFISFDRSPFSSSWSSFKKWMLIESLLKTIREFITEISTVTFLVKHKPMIDDHLDFSFSWPIEGFLEC